MVDRIKQVMEHYEETPAEFAEKIGVNRSNLTHLFSGRNQPSLDFAKKVLLAFPEVSTEWLIMGVGNMIKDPDEEPIVKREFIQTDLFGTLEEDETNEPEMEMDSEPEPEPEPEEDVKKVEDFVTNGTENDIQLPSEETSTDDVKTDEEEITPSEVAEEVETEVVNPFEQPAVTSPELNIPKRTVHPSGKSNSRTLEKTAAKMTPSHSNQQPMMGKSVTPSAVKSQSRVARPVEKPVGTSAERPRTVSVERPVATPAERPRTVSVERPVAIQNEQTPASREKKIEKIIFFYDDDSFKVYHP